MAHPTPEQLEKMTVADLRKEASKLNLSQSGTRQALISRIMETLPKKDQPAGAAGNPSTAPEAKPEPKVDETKPEETKSEETKPEEAPPIPEVTSGAPPAEESPPVSATDAPPAEESPPAAVKVDIKDVTKDAAKAGERMGLSVAELSAEVDVLVPELLAVPAAQREEALKDLHSKSIALHDLVKKRVDEELDKRLSAPPPPEVEVDLSIPALADVLTKKQLARVTEHLDDGGTAVLTKDGGVQLFEGNSVATRNLARATLGSRLVHILNDLRR